MYRPLVSEKLQRITFSIEKKQFAATLRAKQIILQRESISLPE